MVTRISFLLLYTKQLFSQLPSHVCSLSTLSAPVLLPLPLFFHLPSPSSAFPLILVFFTHLTDVFEGYYGAIFFLKSCVSDKRSKQKTKLFVGRAETKIKPGLTSFILSCRHFTVTVSALKCAQKRKTDLIAVS